MSDRPPQRLTALLESLQLATEADVQRLAGRVRRLARGLPLFDSVWIDALAQVRRLTPYQAAELKAGRGAQLRVDAYLIEEPLEWPLYARGFRARHLPSGRGVRLTVIEPGRGTPLAAALLATPLERLAALGATLDCPAVTALTESGADDHRAWVAAPWTPGRSAAHWVQCNGRIRPVVVLEIARQMVAALLAIEQAKLIHGDLCCQGVLLTPQGDVLLPQPGLRPIVRPQEGYGLADLAPAAYEYLAPERISHGKPPTLASDLYACGCVWWHMLAGRPPVAGGDSLGTLQAAHAARVTDVRRLVPDAPAALSTAIAACLQADPHQRPEALSRLAAMLGPSTRAGRSELADCVPQSSAIAAAWLQPLRRPKVPQRGPLWLVAATAALAIVGLSINHVWRSTPAGVSATAARETPQSPAVAAAQPVALTPQHRPPVEPPSEPLLPGAEAVVPAGANMPAATAASAARLEEPGEESVVPVRSAEELLALWPRLQPGQIVRGSPRARPQVTVSDAGLTIAVDRLRLENIDFHWRPASGDRLARGATAAMIRLAAAQCDFRGCSFQVEPTTPEIPAAVLWTYPTPAEQNPLTLPSGRVALNDCVLRNVACAVDCRTAAALGVQLTNVLALGGGPLVQLDHAPAVDEPVSLVLSRVTLRNTGPLLDCRYAALASPAGAVTVRAQQCVLAPEPRSPLIRLAGSEAPDGLLARLEWSGQGALLAPNVAVAAWQGPGGPLRPLDDAAFSISGLVRSEVGFAAADPSDLAASRVMSWQVPLRSPDPPGADPDLLPGAVPMTAEMLRPRP